MKAIRVGCIVLGIVFIIIGLTADWLGIGFDYPGIGMFQTAFIVVGFYMVVMEAIFYKRRNGDNDTGIQT